MTFSLVHPSRQRAVRAAAAIAEWRAAASGQHAVEHVLSVDDDDPELPAYRELADRLGSRLIVGPNKTMVEAVNRGAAAAVGDVLVALSDDFGCPHGWDDAVWRAIGGRREAALWVHDGIHGRIMTLPILTRAFYQRVGYIYHPAYISMYADDDLTEVARRHDAVVDVRDALLFPHRHASVNLGESDATHARQNSMRSWWHGWRMFEHRRIDGFGVPSRGLAPALARLRIDAYYYVRTSGARLRQAWLPLLPASAQRVERRLRTATLNATARLTSVAIRD